MRTDIDLLMEDRGLDGVVVLGDTGSSPTVYYLTGGVKLEGVVIILRPKQPGILVHSPIERDNAAQTGFQCVPYSRWNLARIHEAVEGDRLGARVELLRQMLAEFGVRGRVGFYGHGEIGQFHTLLTALKPVLHGAEVVTEFDQDLFTTARITKDADELDFMLDVARHTNAVVGEVADLLSSRPVSDGHLVAPGGEPMTVGHVKAFVREELARRGLEEPGEHIFAIGGDAGVPHNQGNPQDVLELGKSIIFDLFPRPLGGGYYHDMTRTWCLGHAPAEVEAAYEDVMASFDLVVAALKPGRPTADFQALTCEYFEGRGHETVLSNPRAEAGYVHSLGHGLGLEVHEAPSFSTFSSGGAVLEKGNVFTVEPGLYYPERGFGVRIEDTFYCDDDGKCRSMTDFRKDLVLPVRP